MQRTIIECVKPLFEESLKDQSLPLKDAEMFVSFMEDVSETWEMEDFFEKEFLFHNLTDELKAIVNTIEDIHKRDVLPTEIQNALDGNFDINNPETWSVIDMTPIEIDSGKKFKFPTDKEFYQILHPNEALHFLPEEVEFRVVFLLEADIEDTQNISIRFAHEDDEKNLSKIKMVVSLPYKKMFAKGTTAEGLRYATRCFFRSVYRIHCQKDLAIAIRRILDTSNFIAGLEDELPESFKKPIITETLEDSKFKNASFAGTYAQSRIAFNEDTTRAKLLRGFSLQSVYVLETECIKKYLQLFPTYKSFYFKELSKQSIMTKGIVEFIDECMSDALKLVVLWNKDSIKRVESEEDEYLGEGEYDKFISKRLENVPSELAFFKDKTYEKVFKMALAMTLHEGLTTHITDTFRFRINQTILSPYDNLLERDFMVGSYIQHLLYTHLHPHSLTSRKANETPDIIALGLLGLGFEQSMSDFGLFDNRKSLAATLHSNSPDTTEKLKFIFGGDTPSGELVFRAFIKEQIRRCLGLVGVIDDPTTESAAEISEQFLEKALDVALIDDIYLYRSGETDAGMTYLHAYLTSVCLDLTSMTPLHNLCEIIARDHTRENVSKGLLQDTPFENNKKFYDAISSFTQENSREIQTCLLEQGDNTALNIILMGLQSVILQDFISLSSTNSLPNKYTSLFRDTLDVSNKKNELPKLFNKFLEWEGIRITYKELQKYFVEIAENASAFGVRALSFFVFVDSYSTDLFYLSAKDKKKLNYLGFKKQVSDYAKIGVDIHELSTKCSHATVGSKLNIKKDLAPFSDIFKDILGNIVKLSESLFVGGLPKTSPKDVQKFKEAFFKDEEIPKLDIDLAVEGLLGIFECLNEIKTRNEKETPYSYLVFEQDRCHTLTRPIEVLIYYSIDKLGTYPYKYDAKNSKQLLQLTYYIVYFYELVCRLEIAIAMSFAA